MNPHEFLNTSKTIGVPLKGRKNVSVILEFNKRERYFIYEGATRLGNDLKAYKAAFTSYILFFRRPTESSIQMKFISREYAKTGDHKLSRDLWYSPQMYHHEALVFKTDLFPSEDYSWSLTNGTLVIRKYS